jgi:hypothetical protein
MAVLLLGCAASAAPADDYVGGKFDARALAMLHEMVEALPLRTTLLHDIAPAYAVGKHEGLTWEEAVAEADRRFGKRQPERCAFLRKYLAAGAPESRLAELQWKPWGPRFSSGEGTFISLAWGPNFKDPDEGEVEARIDTQVADQRIIRRLTLALARVKFKDVVYSMTFDAEDHLVHVSREDKPVENGMCLDVTQSVWELDGTIIFSASVRGPRGPREMIDITPAFAIKGRRVLPPLSGLK